jgi:hypothetical protein
LTDPAGRGAERTLARFGLIPYAPPVFTPCARAPLAGLLLGLPALASTGLLDTAHAVYGELPNGFYSLDAMLCAGAPARRAPPASTGRRWAGCWVWTGAGGQDDPPQDRAARRHGRRGRMDRRDGPPARRGPPRAGRRAVRGRACARLCGHPQDRQNPCAAVEVPRPGHPGNLGVRCGRGSAAGGAGRTRRLPGRRSCAG